MGAVGNLCEINIIHFNDIYNVEPQDIGFGAARFVRALHSRQDSNPLTFFSGDAFNPSLMSTVTKGSQMVSVLNACNVTCAVYGNHDFDFGVDTLLKHVEGTKFPWLLSNVYDNITGTLLAEGKSYHILEHMGKKIGLIGLVEEEWLETLSTIDPEDVTFLDFVAEGRALADELKKMGVDMVIALTHMRWPNDERLAREVSQIDLILGGHDHDYGVKKINNHYIVKSGTDFRQFSDIKLTFPADGSAVQVDIKQVDLPPELPEDPEVKTEVDKYLAIMGERMNKILGYLEVEMDGRFQSVRTRETNLGNFITDIMLSAIPADVALLNSGTMRSDRIHPKGPFRLRDLMLILPMVDPIVVIEVTGKDLLAALENGVSKYPMLEGRFPQVAGISFGFNPNKPAGQRINPHFVRVQGHPLDLCMKYTVATKEYVAAGSDGFTAFEKCPVLIDEEKGPRLSTIVQNHFTSVQIVRGEKVCLSNHRQSLVSVLRRQKLRKQVEVQTDSSSSLARGGVQSKVSITSAASKREAYKRRHSMDSLEVDLAGGALAPQVEGRIYLLSDQTERLLQDKKLAADVVHETIREETEAETSLTCSTSGMGVVDSNGNMPEASVSSKSHHEMGVQK